MDPKLEELKIAYINAASRMLEEQTFESASNAIYCADEFQEMLIQEGYIVPFPILEAYGGEA